MRQFIFTLTAVAALTVSLTASAQQGQTPDPMEIASKMTDNLIKDFDLDVAQAFKIDTMLQSAYTAYYAEINRLSKAGVSTTSGQYQRVSDKWGDYIDKFIESVMTDEQWAKYLKSDAGKNKKRRDKRMADDKY